MPIKRKCKIRKKDYIYFRHYYQDCILNIDLISHKYKRKRDSNEVSYIERVSRWQILVKYTFRWEKG